MPTLADFDYDGKRALRELVEQSIYGSLEQVIASLTVFTHPNTVRLTAGDRVFPAVRFRAGRGEKKGGIKTDTNGVTVFLDDNQTPTNAFLWANRIRRNPKTDLQINHVWNDSEDVSSYTALWNLCMTPSFLAKLTDTDQGIQRVLRHHATIIYGDLVPVPLRAQLPRPDGYAELRWADYPAPYNDCDELKQFMLARMRRAPRSRTTVCARDVGWCFNDGGPEPELNV
ncbi:MAG: hypothetical protein ABMA26_27360 [Limisphaerales bacterium]